MMRTESADYREGFAAGRDDARAQMDALYDQNYQLESELNQLRARAQRLEAALVLTEDQRDKANAHRDSVLQSTAVISNRPDNERLIALMTRVAEHAAARQNAERERDAAVAERDEARKALSDLRSSLVWEDK